ncbi:hypothetical protein [Nitrospirillum amazonense]|uniref:hypothetical protein n=1 Tax=Nitrospirillum amazonense TaxID=28077 RepID=UPI0024127632|nr:hypothetical protein [Nitrospirillum amazonense]MDG3444623.1 hypothetical protein [Nitrospirillum amazonense]
MFDLNHEGWLETVPAHVLPFVAPAMAAWNAGADEFNQWSELGWDERDDLVRQAAERTMSG